MRISGFASGMDIDSMVKDMMKAKRVSVDKLGQKKQLLEWQRESYREINAKIVAFRNNKLFNLNKQAEFSQVKASVTGENNVVSVKASSTAVTGTTTIVVSSLAEPAKNVGNDIRNASKTPIDTSKALGDEATLKSKVAAKVTAGETYTFAINGSAPITIDPATMSVNDVVSQINSKTNVQAFYDEGTGKMVLTSKDTGDNAKITITDTDGFLSGVFGVTDDPTATGKDAVLKINGVDTKRSSNTFTLNGVDITLLGKSTSTTTITTGRDIDKIVDDIKSFINDYNDLLKWMQDKVGETRYRSFMPLTDDQRSAMKESEITQWETKAKSGLLAKDSILAKTINDMRLNMMTKVNTGSGTIKQMTSIGLETGQYYEGGKLYLKDESKLREALASDPNAVMALFTANPAPVPDPSDPTKKLPINPEDQGLFTRLYGTLKTTLDSLSDKAGTSAYSTSLTDTLKTESVLGKSLKDLTDKIRDQNARLTIVENRYYKQFTDMETAMNKFNSQSNSLFGMRS